ncbi:hypothetical protein [Brucella tritici]|uniref:Uncharacterized protein n=1 Tax=Brucella tritici TaxID=94626 RepID=A0A6L3YRN9_9HYPH|nr:hypothetical protein [Brucella tritici]KAB2686060.1 hypothetical protein F9L08_12075 [Brucella tritici]
MTNTITDIKREFIDGVAAITFKVAGEANLEWLDDDNHNLLISNGDSHLSINGNFSDEIYDDIVKQLEEWLEENPVKIEWSENNGFHGGFMDGGSYDTLAEAEAALEGVKAEFFCMRRLCPIDLACFY